MRAEVAEIGTSINKCTTSLIVEYYRSDSKGYIKKYYLKWKNENKLTRSKKVIKDDNGHGRQF